MTRKPAEGRPEFTLALCEQMLRDNPQGTAEMYGKLGAALEGKPSAWHRSRKPRKPKTMAARAV